jgi:potassium-transporting ATPase KdpC subunit
MRRQLVPALLVFIVLTVLTGVLYPLAVTGIAQVAFPGRSDGSFVERNGVVVGSELLGQSFPDQRYFQPRPSAAGDGYDGAASSASNLGPTNQDLLTAVSARVAAYRKLNGLARGAEVPVDAVTSSGSGLDPHISPENARLQAPRVARTRGVPVDQVLALVEDHTDGRSLGFLGEPGVNVLALNLALDALSS